MAFDFTDFYIIYPGHPRFNDLQIIEDDVVRVIIQKWELLIFTNKGELFCDPEFGGDLPKYLHETRLSAESIEMDLRVQISEYIEELQSIEYKLEINFFEDPERYQEYMEIKFEISEYEVFAVVT
jgi:hypothetical protein